MKRFIIILLVLLNCCIFGISVSAEETTYENVITDDTTIEEDFLVLGMDINNYYIPNSYDYAKWYVVAMSESYIDDTTIQTYFYIYNPKKCSGVEINTLYYALNNVSNNQKINAVFNFNEHGLYKVKGFSYVYTDKANIKISKIDGAYIPNKSKVQPMASLPPLGTDKLELSSTSDFEAMVSHSTQNNTLSVELEYDSTLIIDTFEVVAIEVKKDDNFINNWNSFWSCEDTSMYAFFYNFNFPDYIEYDSVEYAKFKYDYVNYHEIIYLDSLDFTPSVYYAEYNVKEIVSCETVIQEYNNDSKTLRVNNHSQELNFPTFYLGNRIEDNQFGSLRVSGELDSFDYDCSVLLDSTYRYSERKSGYPKPMHIVPYNDVYYTGLDDIEFLELWYKHNGVLYKCQIASKPVDEDDIQHGTAETPGKSQAEKNWLQKILIKIADFFLRLFQINPDIIPNLGKYLLGSGLIVVGVIIGLVVLSLLLIPGIRMVLKKFLTILGGGIWFIVSLPFRLIGKIFKKE